MSKLVTGLMAVLIIWLYVALFFMPKSPPGPPVYFLSPVTVEPPKEQW